MGGTTLLYSAGSQPCSNTNFNDQEKCNCHPDIDPCKLAYGQNTNDDDIR